MAPPVTTSYTEASTSGETPIERNVQPEFVGPLTIYSILIPTSSFSDGFKHRRVRSAPTQLTLFCPNSICTTPSTVAIPSRILVRCDHQDETEPSNGVAASANTTTPLHEDNENGEENMNVKEHEELLHDHATGRDICAKTIAATPFILAEATTNTPPITGPPAVVADENAGSKPDSSVGSIIPVANITLTGEAEDEAEDKTGDHCISEESSDDDFMDRMCEIIEVAVPMTKPSLIESTPAGTVLDAAGTTPASPVTVEAPCVATTVREDTRSKMCSPFGTVIPHIVIVSSTPPASPAATPSSSSSLTTSGIAFIVPSKAVLSSKEKDGILATLEAEEEKLAQQAKHAVKSLRDRWCSRI